MTTQRSGYIGVRVEPALKASLIKLAKADRRTLTSYVEKALHEKVEAEKKRAGEKSV